ncbi:cell division protein PerM [Micromonospora sp. L31]|uniref:cell division protein PerM n=1 Tax=Micromonospora sp. L31 TaxID=3452213 RepID=UPI003F89659F
MSPVTPDQPRRPAAGVRADARRDDARPAGTRRTDDGRRTDDARRKDARREDARREDARREHDRPGGRPASGGRVPAPRRPESGRGRAPLVVAAGVAAGWAALTSYLPVALVLALAQISEDAGSVAGALRAGLSGWLLGHGVPLQTTAGPLGLVPLLLSGLAFWRLTRAGVHTSRAMGARGGRSPRQALTAAVAVGLGYGLFGALAAVLVSTDDLRVSPVRAGVTHAVFGALAALVGALRTTGVAGLLAERAPAALRDGVRTGLVAGLLLLGAGAGAAGLAVATGGGDAADMISAYRTGVAGQAGITLVSLAYAPNATIWSTAYLLGPGFAVGAGTAVRTSEVSVGALPAVPLLAGLPSGPVDGFGAALLAVPVLAGMAAGWLLARRLLRDADERAVPDWAALLGPAALAGPVVGLLAGLAAAASGGPLGGGRLAEIGPVPWQVAAVSTAVVTVGALLGAAAARVLARPAPRA